MSFLATAFLGLARRAMARFNNDRFAAGDDDVGRRCVRNDDTARKCKAERCDNKQKVLHRVSG
jgi:hypothetical protein